MSAREFLESMMASQAREAFSKHEIVSQTRSDTHVSYSIRRPGTGQYSTTIIASTHRALIVHGDIDPLSFQYGPKNLDARFHWLANPKCSSYFVEKAAIGTGDKDVLFDWNTDVAKEDVVDLAHLMRENGAGESWCKSVSEVADRIDDESTRQDVLGYLYDLNVSGEDMCDIGLVYSTRLIYVHAAIFKLSELLGIFKLSKLLGD